MLAILLILRERHLGLKSSGIQFVFWMVLLIYEVIRLRSMSLIHQDDLVLVGVAGQGGVGQMMQLANSSAFYFFYQLVFLVSKV